MDCDRKAGRLGREGVIPHSFVVQIGAVQMVERAASGGNEGSGRWMDERGRVCLSEDALHTQGGRPSSKPMSTTAFSG